MNTDVASRPDGGSFAQPSSPQEVFDDDDETGAEFTRRTFELRQSHKFIRKNTGIVPERAETNSRRKCFVFFTC